MSNALPTCRPVVGNLFANVKKKDRERRREREIISQADISTNMNEKEDNGTHQIDERQSEGGRIWAAVVAGRRRGRRRPKKTMTGDTWKLAAGARDDADDIVGGKRNETKRNETEGKEKKRPKLKVSARLNQVIRHHC